MVAVSGIVNYEGKVLIGKKRSDSFKKLAGKWHIPGETIEEGESDEEALVRGMKEETQLDIIVGDYICSSISPTSKSQVRWYECFSKTDKINCSGKLSDLEDVKWVNKRDVLFSVDKEAKEYWPKKIFEYFK